MAVILYVVKSCAAGFCALCVCWLLFFFKGLEKAICVCTCMVLVLSGIGVVRDGGDLGDVAEPLAENKLGCDEDTPHFGVWRNWCV